MKLLNYVLLNGVLTDANHPSIISGFNKNYICPDPNCGESLIARKGRKNVNHFSHKSKNKCFGFETALHLKSKEIIENLEKLFIPKKTLFTIDIFEEFQKEILEIEKEYKYQFYLGDFPSEICWGLMKWDENFILFSDIILDLSKYEVESEVLLEGLVPDIKLTNKVNGNVIYIEIAVTSFVKEDKRKLIEQKGLTVLELDLSKYYKSSHYSPEKTEELEQYLKEVLSKGSAYFDSDYFKENYIFYNWINIKNEKELLINRKKRLVTQFQNKLSEIYKFYNNEFINKLKFENGDLRFTREKELINMFDGKEHSFLTKYINYYKEHYLSSIASRDIKNEKKTMDLGNESPNDSFEGFKDFYDSLRKSLKEIRS